MKVQAAYVNVKSERCYTVLTPPYIYLRKIIKEFCTITSKCSQNSRHSGYPPFNQEITCLTG